MTGVAKKRRTASQVTAEDVARVLGVSQSTISRAFTVSASIAEETKERVLKTATALGYRPNVIARSLITRRTSIVAIVIENLAIRSILWFSTRSPSAYKTAAARRFCLCLLPARTWKTSCRRSCSIRSTPLS